MADLVMNYEAFSRSTLIAHDRHERLRNPDGPSAIDPSRKHLNKVLCGGPSPLAAVSRIEKHVQPPTKRTEKPYARLVLSASPEYFRPKCPGKSGSFDGKRLVDFVNKSQEWLKETFGKDIAHVSLHLDETTPHIHVVLVPTYEKKPRKPGKKKAGETDQQFRERQQAALDAPGVRTVSRSCCPYLKHPSAIEDMRKSLAAKLDPLGIGYGRKQQEGNVKTRQWLRDKAKEFEDYHALLTRKADELRKREMDLMINSDPFDLPPPPTFEM